MVTRLLAEPAHVILCFRAEPKVEAVREGGQTKIIPKPSLTGLDGWIPISEKMLPYELTASFLLMADAPGVPRPIKLQEQHKPFVPLDEELSEETGRRLAEWAQGSAGGPETPKRVVADSASVSPAHEEPAAPSDEPFISDKQRRLLFATAKDRGLDQAAIKAILRELTGQESSKAITRDVFDSVLVAVERAGTPA
jgi:hypothetical protein